MGGHQISESDFARLSRAPSFAWKRDTIDKIKVELGNYPSLMMVLLTIQIQWLASPIRQLSWAVVFALVVFLPRAHKSFGFAPAEVHIAHALPVSDANGHAVIVPNAAEKLFLYPGLNADLVP